MARKKHQYFWVIETFSTDSTSKLSCRYERQRNSGQLERLVSCQVVEIYGFLQI